MSTVRVIQVGLISIVAVVAGLRVARLARRPGDLSARSLAFALICLDVGMLLGVPAVYEFCYGLLGNVPGLPQLFQHAATIGAAFFTQVFTLTIVHGHDEPDAIARGYRRRRLAVLAGLAALVLCYLVGPLRLGLHQLGANGEHDLGVAAYVAVTQLYAAVALADTARTSWRLRRVGRPFLGTGLRLFGVGCGFALLFSLHKMLYFAATTFGLRLPWDESGNSGIQLAFIAPAVVCVCVGVLLPFWGPRLVAYRRHRATFLRLAPLAAAIRGSVPDPERVGPLWGAHARLLRRVIHIRDSLIGPLRDRLSPDVYEAARRSAVHSGLTPEEAAVVAEAVCIHEAVRSFPPSSVEAPSTAPPLRLGDDLDSEAAWLARVSDAYARSELVRALLADRRAPTPH